MGSIAERIFVVLVMRKVIMVFFVFTMLYGCVSRRPIPPSDAKRQDSTTLVLKEGQTVFLEREQVNLTFNRVVEDSRCPEGVNCVWAGIGAVELTAMGTYTRPQTFILATEKNAKKNYEPSAVFNGYTYRLNALMPYPTQEKSSKRETYSVEISVN
ncbi:hypothetical protein [Sphingobacterium griseoflavum]|uniref:Proteinase inhibitor I42 chagasin domain-containing protein n=1 Tax=Sphingobacterium griseoflavum TaxID=1474952 RepID=A0ABQ3HTQ3_9SPHI|nr:hypothetical protein [Sphingobacterium griseoflavum]GHE33622.1 hypothetical protein GCM10017764_16010 [Sphingobacterium griseoflavum]